MAAWGTPARGTTASALLRALLLLGLLAPLRGLLLGPAWAVQRAPSRSWGVPGRGRGSVLWADVHAEEEEDDFRRLAERLHGACVYFVGMMGTGKSTAGRELAKKLPGYSFLDTDTVIEAYAGRDCGTIFEKDGEDAFRELESMVMDQACSFRRLCVATGGGAVLRNQNWGKMQTGIVVWLDMAPADIAARLGADDDEVAKRPLLQGGDPAQKLEEILEVRQEKYAIADVRVEMDPDESVEEIVSKVCDSIHTFIDEHPPKFAEQTAEFLRG